MKYAIAIASLAVLAGCATHPVGEPLAQRSWGSWLDQTGRLQTPRAPMADEEAATLLNRAVALRERADAVRLHLNTESDRVKRMQDYRELSRLNDELAPIEQKLASAGRPSRVRQPS